MAYSDANTIFLVLPEWQGDWSIIDTVTRGSKAYSTSNGCGIAAQYDGPFNGPTFSRTDNYYTDYSLVTQISASVANIAIGADYTVECFANLAYSSTVTTYLFGTWGANNTYEISLGSTGNLSYYAYVGSGEVLSGGNIYSYGVTSGWVHIAISRASGTLRMFINGQLAGTLATTKAFPIRSCALVVQRSDGNSGYRFSNIRVSNIARYTANFTPPTDSFPGGTRTLIYTGGLSSTWTPSSTRYKNKNIAQTGAVSPIWTPSSTTYKNQNITASGANVGWTLTPSNVLRFVALEGKITWTSTIAATISISASPPEYYAQTASGALAKSVSMSTASYGGGIAPSLTISKPVLTTATSNVYPVPEPTNIRGPILSLATSVGANWQFNGPTASLVALGTTYEIPGARIAGPSYSLSARTGPKIVVAGPTTTITASSTVINLGKSTIRAPQTIITSTIQTGNLARATLNWYSSLSVNSSTGAVLETAFKLQKQLSASSTISGFGIANLTGPNYSLTATAQAVVKATATIRTPILSSSYGVARINTPILSITASTVRTTGHTVAYVMNLENAAVTKYLNYAFDNIVNFGNKFYGIKSDGVYLLEGDTDNGTSIPATIELPPTDFGSAIKKRVSDYYIDSSNTTVITPNVDGSDIGPYTAVFTGRKTQTGRGAKGRYWGLKVENSSGGAMNINSIEIQSSITSRRVD